MTDIFGPFNESTWRTMLRLKQSIDMDKNNPLYKESVRKEKKLLNYFIGKAA